MSSKQKPVYDREFFEEMDDGSLRSARSLVPMVLEYAPSTSVVDVGCGTGAWLSVFQENGVADVLGLDGDYVDRNRLRLADNNFLAYDLTMPITVGRKFDLAMSVEVAEHLAESHAAAFVGSLVDLAPVVLFSAAIPDQAGLHHVNEQWPEYWTRLFADHGYVPVDCLRMSNWNNDEIEYWYRQNLIFFVDQTKLSDYPKLAEKYEADTVPPRLVHPKLLERYALESKLTLVKMSRGIHGVVASQRGRK